MENQPGGLTGQLVAALNHAHKEERAAAALALGCLGAFEASEALIHALGDRSALVHKNASRALGLLGSPVVGTLLAVIQDPPFRGADLRAGEALSHLQDPEALDLLIAALKYEETPAREGAITALGNIENEQAVPVLIEIVETGEPALRKRAIEALLKINSPQSLHILTSLLADEDARIRVMGVRGLGQLGGEQALLSLLTMLDDDDESVRSSTAGAINAIDFEGDFEILLTVLHSGSQQAQQVILESLCRYKDPVVNETLYRTAYEEGDLETRLLAAQSLALSGDARGLKMIRRTFNAPNQSTRRLAAIALGRTGDLEAAGYLLSEKAFKQVDTGTSAGRAMRGRIVRSLVSMGEGVLPQLIAALGDRDSNVRGVAGEAIRKMGDRAAAALGEALLKHSSVPVRSRAAALLGQIRPEEALEPLMAVLRTALLGPYLLNFFARIFYDRSMPVRRSAARALGDVKYQEGASILLSTARLDPNLEVRQAAREALAHNGAPRVAARFARPDIFGLVNHGIAGGFAVLLVGFLAGLINHFYVVEGLKELTPLVGLGVGAALGVSDTLAGQRRPILFALVGCLAAWVFAFALGMTGRWDMFLSLSIFGLPALGALGGWGRQDLFRRLAGLFVGIVLGFAGGLAAMLLLNSAV